MFASRNLKSISMSDSYFNHSVRNLRPIRVVEFDVCEHGEGSGCVYCLNEGKESNEKSGITIVKDIKTGEIKRVPESRIRIFKGNVFLKEEIQESRK